MSMLHYNLHTWICIHWIIHSQITTPHTPQPPVESSSYVTFINISVIQKPAPHRQVGVDSFNFIAFQLFCHYKLQRFVPMDCMSIKSNCHLGLLYTYVRMCIITTELCVKMFLTFLCQDISLFLLFFKSHD